MAKPGPQGPSKLTPEIVAEVCRCIKCGMTWNDIAGAVNISAQTLWCWRKAGKRCDDQVYVDFLIAVKKAQSDFVKQNVSKIRKHGGKSWQALAWLLERRRPDLFALRNEAEYQKLLAEVAELRAIVGEKVKQ